MRSADVVIKEDLCGCGKIDDQEQETVKKMRQPKVAFIQPIAVEQKTYEMSGRAFIDFPVDRTELHPNYRNNPRELAKIVDTINVIKKDANMTITKIEIHGYASPEAPYAHNEYLATNRAATLKNYVRQLVHPTTASSPSTLRRRTGKVSASISRRATSTTAAPSSRLRRTTL